MEDCGKQESQAAAASRSTYVDQVAVATSSNEATSANTAWRNTPPPAKFNDNPSPQIGPQAMPSWMDSASVSSATSRKSDAVRLRLSLNTCTCTITRDGHLRGVQGVQNVPRSAWVKTDAASKPTCLNRRRVYCFAGSVGFYPRAARYILYLLYPPSGAHL